MSNLVGISHLSFLAHSPPPPPPLSLLISLQQLVSSPLSPVERAVEVVMNQLDCSLQEVGQEEDAVFRAFELLKDEGIGKRSVEYGKKTHWIKRTPMSHNYNIHITFEC